MNVDMRVKCDPRADGREARPGDLIELWVRWSCPDDGTYTVKVTSVGPEGDGSAVTVLTSWEEVVTVGEAWGVALPSRPSCPGL